MNLDKFYTKEEVAKQCISMVDNINDYSYIVEPSAGCGNFSKQLNCIAYDILPEGDNIIQQDYLLLKDKFPKHTLVIGNPPFGLRSSLAKKFIAHSIDLGAETIAFILPDTFDKLSNQTVFPDNWRLILKHKLEGTNFILDNQDYYVPCSFYIWTRQSGEVNLREQKLEYTDLFTFLPRGDQRADFAINGNNGKVKDIKDITNPKGEHYIYVNDRTKILKVREFFTNAVYDFKSSVNGNNAWLGQQDILKYFYYNYQ